MTILVSTGPSWIPYTNKAGANSVTAESHETFLRDDELAREEQRSDYMDRLRRSGTSDRLNFTSKEVEQLALLLKEQGYPQLGRNLHWSQLPEDVQIVFGYGDNLSCKAAAEVHSSWLHDWTGREDLCSTTPLTCHEEWTEAAKAADVLLMGGASQEEVVKVVSVAGETPVWGQLGTGFRGYHTRGVNATPEYGVINN